MNAEERRATDLLDRALDRLAGGRVAAVAEPDLDSAFVQTAQRLRALYAYGGPPDPDSLFMQRLGSELMHPTPPVDPAARTPGRLGFLARPWSGRHPALPSRRRSIPRFRPIGHGMADLAIVGALIVALGAAWLTYRGTDLPADDPRPPASLAAPGDALDAAACQVEPASLDRLALTGTTTARAITLDAGSDDRGLSLDAGSLPTDLGLPADEATVAGVTKTVEELVACYAAGDPARASALFTDAYWRRLNEAGFAADPKNPRTFANLMQPELEETPPMPAVEEVRMLPDGRVGAVIRPGFAAPTYMFDYFVFARVGEEWLIDEAGRITVWAPVELVIADDGFVPADVQLPGQPVELSVQNQGGTSHSLVIPDLGVRVEVGAGGAAKTRIAAPAGTYSIFSDVSNDRAAGLTGTLTIADGGAANVESMAGTAAGARDGEVGVVTASADAGGSGVVGGNTEAGASGGTTFYGQADGRGGDATGSVSIGGVPGVSSGGGGAPPVSNALAAAAAIAARPPTGFTVQTVAIPANQDVIVTLSNPDPSQKANFTIDALRIDVALAPGATATITVNAPAGVYAFYSDLPGHAQAGMTGTLVVVDEKPASGGPAGAGGGG